VQNQLSLGIIFTLARVVRYMADDVMMTSPIVNEKLSHFKFETNPEIRYQ